MKLNQWMTVVLFSLLASGCRRAEGQSQLTADARLPGSFGSISNVVELSDGRVVFADTKAKLFLRADLQAGRVDTLGSRADSVGPGSPPGRYKFPGWVAHLGGDTVALVDFSATRTTLWNEAGRPLTVLAIKPVAGNTPVLTYDTLGHGYKVDYQAVLGGGEPGRALRPDSIPVLRFTLQAGTVDTVAHLSSPEYGDAVFGEEVQQAAKVFAPNDFFGVLPDGTAWVARARLNRVDWRSPDGRWTMGQPREYARIPVTQRDKERVLAQVREQGKQFGMPQELRIVYPFAETRPAFEAAVGRPAGEVWLQRPRKDEASPLVYDVYDRKSKWRREVVFPRDASLAGFGAGDVVYAVIKNPDGSRTIGRYKARS
jgi:hypothetical protein